MSFPGGGNLLGGNQREAFVSLSRRRFLGRPCEASISEFAARGGASSVRGELRVVPRDCDPGIGAPVSVRVSPRARRVALRINSAERKVEPVLPRGVPVGIGLRFLAAKRDWVGGRLEALPRAVPFVEGADVRVLWVPHRICRELDPAAPPVRFVDGEIRVRGDPMHLARPVRDRLVAAATAELALRARRLAGRLDAKWRGSMCAIPGAGGAAARDKETFPSAGG